MKKNISKNNVFIIFGIFFLLFTFIWNIINDIFSELLILIFLILILINFFIVIKKYFIILLFIVIWSILGLFSSYIANQKIAEKLKILEPLYNIEQNIIWKIIWVKKITDFKSEYIIQLDNKVKWLILIPSNFNIRKGDIINFTEKITKIENFNNSFNYEKFSYSKNIFFKINARSINIIWKEELHPIRNKIDNVRIILLEKINHLYPKEEAIFLWWILLWARESMPENLKTNFNNSGLTHFIAVSGFNITILIIFFAFILKPFPVFIKAILITTLISFFVILVWDTVSVIRASLMWLIGYYIMISGRIAHNLWIIIFVWIIMALLSPLSINYDISLHLSFLAVLWILYCQKKLNSVFSFIPNFLAIRDAFVLTLSAMTFALPIILFNFGQLSLMSPFANIAVTWTIPFAMLWWFLSIIVDFFHNWLATWIAYFTWILLAWDIKMVHFFGELDWAIIHSDLGIYKYSLEILYFIILIFLINYFSEEKK